MFYKDKNKDIESNIKTWINNNLIYMKNKIKDNKDNKTDFKWNLVELLLKQTFGLIDG